MAWPKPCANVGLEAQHVGIAAAQLGHGGGVEGVERRDVGEGHALQALHLLVASLLLGRPGPGQHQLGADFGKLLLAHEAAAGDDDIVLDLVVLDLALRILDARRQLGEARRDVGCRLAGRQRSNLAVLVEIGLADRIGETLRLLRALRPDGDIHHEAAVGALDGELPSKLDEGLVHALCHAVVPGIGTRCSAGEFGIAVEPLGLHHAQQHCGRLDDAERTLDFRQQAGVGLLAAQDAFGAHDPQFARIDQQLRRGAVSRRCQQRHGESECNTGRPSADDPELAPPEYGEQAAQVDHHGFDGGRRHWRALEHRLSDHRTIDRPHRRIAGIASTHCSPAGRGRRAARGRCRRSQPQPVVRRQGPSLIRRGRHCAAPVR